MHAIWSSYALQSMDWRLFQHLRIKLSNQILQHLTGRQVGSMILTYLFVKFVAYPFGPIYTVTAKDRFPSTWMDPRILSSVCAAAQRELLIVRLSPLPLLPVQSSCLKKEALKLSAWHTRAPVSGSFVFKTRLHIHVSHILPLQLCLRLR